MDALGTLDVPVSLFVGTHDTVSTPADDRMIRDLFKPSSIYHYEEFSADHLSLLMGKDMTFWTERAMNILKELHPLV